MKGISRPFTALALLLVPFLMATAVAEGAPDAIEPVEAPFPMPKLDRPHFPDRVYDIRGYGAQDVGETKNTEAIRKAIDACTNEGGGTVRVPAGTWLTGAIYLESNVNLHLEKGAELHSAAARLWRSPLPSRPPPSVSPAKGGVQCASTRRSRGPLESCFRGNAGESRVCYVLRR